MFSRFFKSPLDLTGVRLKFELQDRNGRFAAGKLEQANGPPTYYSVVKK